MLTAGNPTSRPENKSSEHVFNSAVRAETQAPDEHLCSESDQEPVRDVQFEVVGRRKEGRPVKLTEARFKRVLENIRRGLTTVKAVRVEGIVYTTWRNHIQRKPEWAKLAEAAEEMREEVWRSEALEAVKAAFPKSWQAAMTYLERRYPNEFALKVLNRNINTNEPLFDRVSEEQIKADLALAREVEKERPLLT